MKLTHKQWLSERRKSIGGSDAAAIVGLNHYVTPYMLWADKTGKLPDKPDNEAMRQGRDLEQYVASRFMGETGKRVRRRTDFFRSKSFPFAHANIDRAVVGERAGLECKTTNVMNLKKFKSGEFPENYYVQCVHYLAVTGWDRWYLACVILGQGFKWFTIERDQAEIDALMKAESNFWNTYVVPNIPPPVDGLPPTSETLETIFQNSDPAKEPADLQTCHDLIRQYCSTKELLKSYQQELNQYKQELQSELGERESGICSNYTVSWKPQTRSSFNLKQFASDHPEIDLRSYLKESKFRKFDIKENSK